MTTADDVDRAFRLDLQRMARDGELWHWPELLVLAHNTLVHHPESSLAPVSKELLAVNALLGFVERLVVGRGVYFYPTLTRGHVRKDSRILAAEDIERTADRWERGEMDPDASEATRAHEAGALRRFAAGLRTAARLSPSAAELVERSSVGQAAREMREDPDAHLAKLDQELDALPMCWRCGFPELSANGVCVQCGADGEP